MISQAQITITAVYDGESLYTWVKYADDVNGSNISDSPVGKTYMGVAYNQISQNESNNPADYTWSLIKGEQGIPGAPGTSGVGITSTTVTYQLHTSGTTAPTGTWTSTVPSPIKGRYMWIRTIFNYTNGTSVTTYAVSYIANDGQTGKGISSTVIDYQIGTSGTVTPTGTWSLTVPTPIQGRFLWTRTTINYTDSTNSIAYSTSYYATDGQKGDTGATTYTWIKYADTILGVGMSDNPDGKRYIGIAYNKTSPTEENVPASYKWSSMYDDKIAGELKSYVQSRGENLVTNGTGLLGNNTNFSQFTFDGSQVYAGGGSFHTNRQNGSLLSDEMIPVDTSKKYRVSLMAKSKLAVGKNYVGLSVLDIDGNLMTPYEYYGGAFPIVELTQPLKYGDTKVHVSDASAFFDTASDHRASLVMWGYKNSYGYEYPAGTYSRLTFPIAWAIGGVDRVNNIITFNKPFPLKNPSSADGVFPIGHKLSPTQSGSGYKYTAVSNVSFPKDWTYYEGFISGVSSDTSAVRFAPGTAFVKLLFLTNRDTSGGVAGDEIWVNSLSLTDISSSMSYTWIKYADTATGVGLSSSPTGKDYIGIAYNKATDVASTNPADYSWSLFRGAQGVPGPTGNGISSTTITYQNGTSGTAAPTSTWSATIPTPVRGQYLWTRTVTAYTNGTSSTTYSVSYTATDGQAGKGISSTAIAYQIGTSGMTAPTGTWVASPPAPIQGRYLWTRTVTTYTDATSSTTYSTSYFATDGQKGDPGTAGVSVTSIVEEYYQSTSATQQVGGAWSTTVPTWQDGKFIWTRAKTSFSNGTTSITTPVNVTGGKGTDGTTTYTWIKYADTATGSGISDSPDGKRYMGVAVNKTSQNESNLPEDYLWSPLYDNVRPGGRNLLRNSRTIEISGTDDAHTRTSTFDDTLFKGMLTVADVSVDAFSAYRWLTSYLSDPEVANYHNQFFTLSVDVKTSSDKFSLGFDFRSATHTNILESPITPIPNTKGEWMRVGATIFVPDDGLVRGELLAFFNAIGAVTGDVLEYKNWSYESSNIFGQWVAAPEDIEEKIDDKAPNKDLENLAQIVSSVSSTLNFKAGMGEFQALEEAFNARVAQDIIDKEQVAADLATIEGRATLIETIAGENKLVTEFIETVITESDEGIYISRDSGSTGILIGTSRISFMDNGTEVAYISNQTMQINHGIFVETATIANFKFELIPGTTILGITWVGE